MALAVTGFRPRPSGLYTFPRRGLARRCRRPDADEFTEFERFYVGPFEPRTPIVQSRLLYQLSYGPTPNLLPWCYRTVLCLRNPLENLAGLLIKSRLLYQLSYGLPRGGGPYSGGGGTSTFAGKSGQLPWQDIERAKENGGHKDRRFWHRQERVQV